MPKGTNQKFKLYRLAQIMLEQTDDEHYITMPEMPGTISRRTGRAFTRICGAWKCSGLKSKASRWGRAITTMWSAGPSSCRS